MRNKFVYSDPTTCIGCSTCVAACLMRHADEEFATEPRLGVVKTRSVSTPVMCHQCDDAPCAKVCPVDALYQEDQVVKVNQARCIGCKSCELACPFGAIRTQKTMASWKLGNVKVAVMPKAYVVKCDLCHQFADGPACLSACPTNSIHLIDASMLEENIQKKQVEAARGSENYSELQLNPAL